MPIDKKLCQELLPVISPEVGIAVKGVLVFRGLIHCHANTGKNLISQIRQLCNLERELISDSSYCMHACMLYSLEILNPTKFCEYARYYKMGEKCRHF